MMSIMFSDRTPLEIVKIALQCHLDCIDWVSLHHCSSKSLRKLSEDFGLEIVTHTMLKNGFMQRRTNALDELKESLEDTCILGAPVMMLPPFGRIKQLSLEDDRRAWIEYFAQGVELAKSMGVTLSMESTGLLDSPITATSEVLELLQAVPELKVTYDHGNIATADDPNAAYLALKDHIVRFHLKDWKIYDAPAPHAAPKRNGKFFQDALIGTGDLDIASFWKLVTPEQRNLPINLETKDFTGRLPPAEALLDAMQFLRSLD